MHKKVRNIVAVLIIILLPVVVVIYTDFQKVMIRQLRGPSEGSDKLFTIDNRLAVVSKGNHIYTWKWDDLSAWPVVAKLQTQAAVPVISNKIVYDASATQGGLVLTDIKAEKQLASLPLPYSAECKRMKISRNGLYGIVSILLKEGLQKGWLKLGVFDSDFKNLNFVFQQDTNLEEFTIYDFTVSNDGQVLAGAGEKGKAWVFVKNVKHEEMLWEKSFSEYGQFTLAEFSPDGKILFVAEKVRFILALNSATGEIEKVFEMPPYETNLYQKQNICCIEISPDGRILAADTEPAGRIFFWDLATGKKIGEIFASELTVSDIAFSPDSKYLATGCLVSPEIKIWKVPQLKH